MALETYSDEAFQRALKRNVRALTRGKTKSASPRAILLGGQSGAGKTTIHRLKQREYQGNLIIIDGDSYRSQHPNFLALQKKYGKASVDHTKVFAGQMVESLVRELSQQGFDLLIEGALRTTEVPRKTAQIFKERGYRVILNLIATKPELSYLSTLIRYEELYALDPSQARATPKEHHDGIVDHLVENLRELENDKLFDQIQIYHRDKSCIFDTDRDSGFAADRLEQALFGKLSKTEKAMLDQNKARLRELREKGRGESKPL